MTEQEVQEFWTQVNLYHNRNGQRLGQSMMNALNEVAPELYADISGTQYDIFYKDTSQDIFRFRDYLGI